MGKIYTALGLMSGTSMDGVDASIIKSDGLGRFSKFLDEYSEFDADLRIKMVDLRNRVLSKDDLLKFAEELKTLERQITIFHSNIIRKISVKYKESTGENIDLIGFHGQTIFHDPKNGVTKQLGDGYLLSQLTKKTVVCDFRQKDLQNDGQGAPLTPIFHNLLSNLIYNKHKDEFSNILNIGGISNITNTVKKSNYSKDYIHAFDIGPGNCLIDEWIRKNSDKKYDEGGLIAKSGKVNQLILNQTIENFKFNSYNESLDIKEFDLSFARGLSLEDGCATITNFTAYLIAEGIKFTNQINKNIHNKYLTCGGGRKNNFLIETINHYLNSFKNITLESIDLYNYDGDYIESQAFGYLAIRSFLGLPITFPTTTRCKDPTTGGVIIKNF
ncbi:anhydro-N-acetylmuramic acid kinase [Candidatus Pelagibacter sp.]|jgi:anhydro-N-acetylmuramic acid kinase|nr:anhydro-N-acetylmuramic acid kinase [Candidatus Pelagibacter sp.]